MNGLLLDETVDYTSNGSAVTLTSGAAAGDEIEVVAYNTFSVGDALPKSGGAMTGDLTVDTNTFHVDVADNRVGVGTTSPNRLFSVSSSTTRTSGFEDIAEYVTPSIGVGGSTSLNVGRANSNYDLGKMAFKYNGAGSTSNELGFGFYGADNLLKIDGAGRVTSPNQPSFLAYGPGSWITVSGGSTNAMTLSSTGYNIGSHYNASNYTFTAPVAGKYLFHLKTYVKLSTTDDDSNHAYTLIQKNGSNYYTAYNIFGYFNQGDVDQNADVTTIMSLSANDTVKPLMQAASGDASYYGGACTFYGILLS